jgi:hypothetical protein
LGQGNPFDRSEIAYRQLPGELFEEERHAKIVPTAFRRTPAMM